MLKVRQFLYYFNDQRKPYIEMDFLERTPIPQKGEVIERAGKSWKVHTVMTEVDVSTPQRMPIYRVFLTDGIYWLSHNIEQRFRFRGL